MFVFSPIVAFICRISFVGLFCSQNNRALVVPDTSYGPPPWLRTHSIEYLRDVICLSNSYNHPAYRISKSIQISWIKNTHTGHPSRDL